MSFLTYLESADHTVFLDINRDIANPVFDAVFPSLRELTYFFWLFVIVYFLIRKEKKLALLVTLGIIVGASLTYPVKFFIDRERPYDQIESARVLTQPESDPSFPSGHAEMSFLAATVISRFHPGYRRYLYAFAFIVALSRVYVGVHFPMDVIGGIIIGIIIGRAMILLAQRKRNILWEHVNIS